MRSRPGRAANRSIVAPSAHCGAHTSNAIAAGCGLCEATDAKSPVSLSRVGKGWEGRSSCVAGFETVETASVVDDEQLAGVIGPESSDIEGRVDQLALPDGSRAVVFDSPDSAGGPVAVDICPDQIEQTGSAINPAAGERHKDCYAG